MRSWRVARIAPLRSAIDLRGFGDGGRQEWRLGAVRIKA
jgi:hypothetical protein